MFEALLVWVEKVCAFQILWLRWHMEVFFKERMEVN